MPGAGLDVDGRADVVETARRRLRAAVLLNQGIRYASPRSSECRACTSERRPQGTLGSKDPPMESRNRTSEENATPLVAGTNRVGRCEDHRSKSLRSSVISLTFRINGPAA